MRKLESKRRHFFSLKNRYGHGRTGRTFAAGPAPSVAYSTESQKTTKTHYVLQNSNKQFQYSFILFHPSSFALPPRLHHNKALFIPLVKTTSFKCSFFVDVIPLWNSLPSNFVSSSSISSFKRLIRSHFSTSFW